MDNIVNLVIQHQEKDEGVLDIVLKNGSGMKVRFDATVNEWGEHRDGRLDAENFCHQAIKMCPAIVFADLNATSTWTVSLVSTF